MRNLPGCWPTKKVIGIVGGGEQWLLKGDNNMAYFHSIANGRRRKTAILSLEDEGIVIEDKDQLRVHITEFYKTLFGKTPPSEVSLHPSIWAEQGHVTKEECNELVKPFSMKEIESAISEMKNNTAPTGSQCNITKNFGSNSGTFLEKCWRICTKVSCILVG